MMTTRQITLFLSAVSGIFLSTKGFCQEGAKMDMRDWLAKRGLEKPRPAKNNFLFLLPVVGANPSAGFIYGAGLTYAYQSKDESTRLSTVSSNASYSTKRLVNLNVKTNQFAFGDRLFLNGDWRYFVISETTYGLGSSIRTAGQSLRYALTRIHETASFKLVRNFFAGIGIHYDHQFHIDDKTVDAGDTAKSYHYQYSIRNGFNPRQNTTSGYSLNLLFDNRDNPINAYKGYYININYRINETAFGSEKNSSILLTEYRSFFSLDGEKRRHILALWLYGNYLISGNLPYLMLPAIGYDQRQKSGRGYPFGRFRGESMLYAEAEYRFPISVKTGILGGVVFCNLTSTSNQEKKISLLNYIQPAYGAGIRIMVDKMSRTRLQLDGAVGNRKLGLYFGIRETF
jgi:outer membrane protein assembly factor BamA